MMTSNASRAIAPFLVAAAFAGCELTEVAIAAPGDAVIVETQLLVTLDDDGGSSLQVLTYLHRTSSTERTGGSEGATVRVSGASGTVVRLEATDSGAVCLARAEEEDPRTNVGSCYRAGISPSPFAPGEVLELEVILPDGRTLTGSSLLPGAFAFEGLTHEDGQCRLEPETHYRFQWTESSDAWAYVSDTRIEGLPEALAGRDIEAPDSLYLTGLAIGREDTDLVFPGEYGLFDFGDGVSSDLLRVLDDGLPGGVEAALAFAATDRNWTNWNRGGNFNPSGLVRIPSVFGDGTGVFGTGTQRMLTIVSGPEGEGMPPLCGPAVAR